MNTKTERLKVVTLDRDRCKGCVACMKRCPTEAIRVRNGKAKIHYDRCVGCGECVRICSYHAKKAVYDDFSVTEGFRYKIALPAPSLYGQFNNVEDIGIIVAGLKKLGFDEVAEVGSGAELLTDETRREFRKDEGSAKRPMISTACPAIVQLILLKYHGLVENLNDLLAPVDVTAKLAKEEAVKRTGLPAEEIGVFFISPCPAKVFALKTGFGVGMPLVDGVLSVSDLYFRLLGAMKEVQDNPDESAVGVVGMSWAASGGEAAGVLKDKVVAADGVENCISVLKELEHGGLQNVDFVELNACVGGCVGGVLNIENPYVAKSKLMALRKFLPVQKNHAIEIDKSPDFYHRKEKLEKNYGMLLDEDMKVAFRKLAEIDEISNRLPSLDCGACGAPSCRAFAEDVVNGECEIGMCVRIGEENENNRTGK